MRHSVLVPKSAESLQFLRRPLEHPDTQRLIDLVQAYYAVVYGSTDDAPLDAAEVSPPRGEMFVGYCEGEPACSAAWRRRLDIPGLPGPVAEIKRMIVRPESRGQGLGRLTLAYVEERIRVHGISTVVLQTGSPQVAAVRLYETSGYGPLPADADISWDPYSGDTRSLRLWKQL